MNFNSNDNPVLVAPRPVRLTAPFPTRHQPVRLVSAPEADRVDEFKLGPSASEKDIPSPRLSPRTALPSEALEEFLSILKPSFFPPRSPVGRRGASLPTFHHERSFSFKGRLLHVDEAGETPRLLAQSPDVDTEKAAEFELVDQEEAQMLRWFTSSVLSSPISRNNTRNPFQRHASYQLSLSPSPSAHNRLSPAAIPLPLPTPDEMAETP